MTLFDIFKKAVNDGYIIEMHSDINQLVIQIWLNNTPYYKQSHLPLSDHFYESRVVECIAWMIEEINKELLNKNL